MRERFAAILESCGLKHWSFGVRRDTEILTWINDQASHLPDDLPFASRVYAAIYNDDPRCVNGNIRTLKNIIEGWKFCGPAGKCQCAKETVSRKVSETRNLETAEQREEQQRKREKTNLAKYGHINSGQTEVAKAAHRDFYADASNIRNQVTKQMETMMALYGVENSAHSKDAEQKRDATLQSRYGVGNPMQIKSVAAKSLATRMAQGYCLDYYRRNYDQLSQRLLSRHGLVLLTPFESYKGVADAPILQLQCSACKLVFEWRLFYNRPPYCRICNPRDISYKSQEELQVYAFIKDELGIKNVISGDRSFVNPFEIDIISHEHSTAIEYCGLYWHSEAQRPDHMCHLNKLRKVEAKGYKLLTIFSDEWMNKPDIVKSKLSYLFNKTPIKLYARKLHLLKLDHHQAAEFYNRSHIQGATRANVHIALGDGKQIVSSMSFGAARASKKLPTNSYELTRFACAPYTSVAGAASRLFSNFVETHTPAAIISYADRRWSDGGLYRSLGFDQEAINPPSYSYVENYTKRHFRFGFRKEILESIVGESDLTEWEIMKSLRYDRIWDCGTYRFVKKF